MPGARNLRTRLFALLMLLTLGAGCTPAVQRGHTDVNLTLAERTWNRFAESSWAMREAAGPFNSVLSIRYKTPEDGFRLSAYIWSNSKEHDSYPLRLDLQSSLGSSVAKILERKSDFLVYDLGDKKAYRGAGSRQAMHSMGMPLPFSLGDLSRLINGRYLEFFYPGQSDVMPRVNAGTTLDESVFFCPSSSGEGELTIDSRGRPVHWTETAGNGWTMEISYLEGGALPGPYKITAEHPSGYSATILVKNFERVSPFTPEQMNLTIPDSVPVQNL